MSLSQGIRNTLVNNRGKLGALAGAGAVLGAQRVYDDNSHLVNQAGFNALVHTNNLVADGANVVRKLNPDLPKVQKIDKDVLDNANKYYNNMQENPTNMFGQEYTSVNPTTAYNIAHGVQGVKNLFNPEALGENTSLTIPIKQLLLEGYSYEEVLEESIAKKLAAGAVAAGLVASAPHAVKTINSPSKVDSSYSIGNKNQHQIPGSEKLKELGVKAPAKQYGTIKAQK